MHRIDSVDIVTTIPSPLAPATAGYFSQGDYLTGRQGTVVSGDWANAVQEELCYVIEISGLVLSKTDRTQLWQALTRSFASSASLAGYVSKAGDTMTGALTLPEVMITGGRIRLYEQWPLETLTWDGGNVRDTYDAQTGDRSWWDGSGRQLMVLDNNTGDLFLNHAGVCAKPGGGPWIDVASDDRVKKDQAPYKQGLDEVCKLRPISYQFNGQGGTPDDGRTYIGLSAQDTQPIMPEMVFLAPERPDTLDGQLTMNLGPLSLALVNSVQTLADHVLEIRERVSALEAR